RCVAGIPTGHEKKKKPLIDAPWKRVTPKHRRTSMWAELRRDELVLKETFRIRLVPGRTLSPPDGRRRPIAPSYSTALRSTRSADGPLVLIVVLRRPEQALDLSFGPSERSRTRWRHWKVSPLDRSANGRRIRTEPLRELIDADCWLLVCSRL